MKTRKMSFGEILFCTSAISIVCFVAFMLVSEIEQTKNMPIHSQTITDNYKLLNTNFTNDTKKQTFNGINISGNNASIMVNDNNNSNKTKLISMNTKDLDIEPSKDDNADLQVIHHKFFEYENAQFSNSITGIFNHKYTETGKKITLDNNDLIFSTSKNADGKHNSTTYTLYLPNNVINKMHK